MKPSTEDGDREEKKYTQKIKGFFSEMTDFFDRLPQNAGFRIRSYYIKVLKRLKAKKHIDC